MAAVSPGGGAHAAEPAASTLPTGAITSAGTGQVNAVGATMVVDQTSSRYASRWFSFSLGRSASVSIVQPDTGSMALLRDTGLEPSQIGGVLSANGTVLQANPNGTIFGSAAVVDVGSLLSTALDLSEADFMGGASATLSAGPRRARVSNQGTLDAATGRTIDLIGGAVSNTGFISAQQGRISLVAADQVSLDLASGRLEATVTGALTGAVDASPAVFNAGTLSAGTIVLHAEAAPGVYSVLVSNIGVVSARGGIVEMTARGGALVNSGTIDVSPLGGAGVGGTVEMSSSSLVRVGGTINASGGRIAVDGANVELSGDLTASQIALNSGFAITQTGGTVTASTLSASASDYMSLNNAGNAIDALGAISVGGSFALASSVSLAQTDALDVAGTSTIYTAGSLDLSNAANHFGGAVSVSSSGSVALRAAQDLRVSSLANGANGSISLVAGGVLTLPATPLDSGSGDLQLASEGGALAVAQALNGNRVSLAGKDGMTLAGPVTAGTQLSLRADPTRTILVTGTLQAPSTLIEGGVVRVGNGGTTGSILGNVTNNGTLVYDHSDAVLVTGTIGGTGGLQQQGTGRLELVGANTYTGATVVSSGTLALSGAGSIASSSGVQVAAPAVFDVSNASANQIDIGLISGPGAIRLGGKTLAMGAGNASSTFAGTLSGAGGLLKTGTGTLTLTGASTYEGGTQLKAGRIDVAHSAALGTGTLAMDDGTTLGFAADGLVVANAIRMTGTQDPVIDTGAFDGTLAGAISGGGFLTKEGSGVLTLTGANTYAGATSVAAGTLRAGAADTFSADSVHSVANGATLDLAGFPQRMAGLTNSGVVSMAGATAGTTLTVTGPYVGNDAVLRMGTALGGSASVSDRLVLSGAAATASGRTTIQITNLGGLGALTSGNGIELVSAVDGATTTAQTDKSAFVLAGGHVDAGAYEYRLQPGDANGAGENWYLRTGTAVASDAPVAAGRPQSTPTYRAEVPLLAALPAQLRQADLSMLGNLHQRVGDDDPREASTGATERRAWGRVLSSDIDVRQSGAASAHSEGRLAGFQAGTDLLTGPAWRAGVYAGELDGNVSVSGFASGVQNLPVGYNDLRSQYVGVYGTYTGRSGFYADAVLQAARHRQQTVPLAGLQSSGKGRSLLASIELGQSFVVGAGWKIEPQVQLVHRSVDLDDMSISGARVQQDSAGDWLARAGLRVRGEIATAAGSLQPYARVNAYRASGATDLTRFVGPAGVADIATPIGRTSWELAAGATLRLSPAVDVYGEAGRLHASGGNEDVQGGIQGSVGLRVRW